jgi:hypothetical protein
MSVHAQAARWLRKKAWWVRSDSQKPVRVAGGKAHDGSLMYTKGGER